LSPKAPWLSSVAGSLSRPLLMQFQIGTPRVFSQWLKYYAPAHTKPKAFERRARVRGERGGAGDHEAREAHVGGVM
jgi:hypothetical protein